MEKKAVVFDNSGTLIERYRVIKDIKRNKLITNINSLNLIDKYPSLALIILQFDSIKLLNIPEDYLISEYIIKNNIDFDLSFSTISISTEKIKKIIEKEKKATAKDITESFSILKEMIPDCQICNGSALIIDVEKEEIAYTITSAGRFFPNVEDTIKKLKENNFEIFIASGDRSGAIKKLTEILKIPNENGFPTASTKRKGEIVKNLKNEGYEVTMVGDGLNDLIAFENSDISILTLEQKEEVSPKIIGKTDYTIEKFSEIIPILLK